jgi:flagellar basal body-associated protein FliL
MQDSRHKRIVINLDQKAGSVRRSATGRPRRWSRLLGTLLIVFVVVAALAVAGGYLWWRHYRATPAYSLALIADAAQRNDVAALEQMLDTDKIVLNLAGQASDQASTRYGFNLDPAARQRLDALVPALLPRVKETVRAELMKTLVADSSRAAGKPFFVTALALPYVVSITTKGDIAKVVLPQRSTEITLNRREERWQIVAIKDNLIAEMVAAKLAEFLPAIGQLSGQSPTSNPFETARRPGRRANKRR